MTDYKVTDAQLTGIANAIRTKGGTESPLVFPDGFVSAIGNIPTGQSIPVLSRAQWNALSTAQKWAYGQLIIQDAVTGFKRGDFVYGADYIPLNLYIPNSDEDKVICEAYFDNFVEGDPTWGNGPNPVSIIGSPVAGDDNSVVMDAYTSENYGYVDLYTASTPFTAYIVAKKTGGGNLGRLISSMRARSVGQGILLYGDTVGVSSWGSDTQTSVDSTNWFAGAIQFSTSGSALGIAGDSNGLSNFITKSPTSAGDNVTIGRTDRGNSPTNAEPSDLRVKYVAVVKEAESQATITANLQNLIAEFVS